MHVHSGPGGDTAGGFHSLDTPLTVAYRCQMEGDTESEAERV